MHRAVSTLNTWLVRMPFSRTVLPFESVMSEYDLAYVISPSFGKEVYACAISRTVTP